jgi:hypothetical protein
MLRAGTWTIKIHPVRLLLALICLVGVWIILGEIIVPWVIDASYHRMSLSLSNWIFQGRAARHPVEHYQHLWRGIWYRITGLIIAFSAVTLIISRPRFFQRYVGEATPGALGTIRMLTCASLLLVTLKYDPAHVAILPPEFRRPMGVMDFLYWFPIGINRFVTNGTALRSIESFTLLVLFLGMIGWRARLVIPLGGLCFLLLSGVDRQYIHLYHQGLVSLYVMVVLSLAPCSDGWSVDRLWKIFRGRATPEDNSPSSIYGWSRYACWVAMQRGPSLVERDKYEGNSLP